MKRNLHAYPFCRQAYHYYDFHFSEERKGRNYGLWQPKIVHKENQLMRRWKRFIWRNNVPYFQPKWFSIAEVYKNYRLLKNLKYIGNSDDLSSGIWNSQQVSSRLSIIQSFFWRDSKMMNPLQFYQKPSMFKKPYLIIFRLTDLRHSGMSNENSNKYSALSFEVPHISGNMPRSNPKQHLKLIETGKIT
jgi:hypothetical protein